MRRITLSLVFVFLFFSVAFAVERVSLQNGSGQEAGTTSYPLSVEQSYSYANIRAAGTTYPKTSPGFLHSVTVNYPIANSNMVIADGNTNNIIATIRFPATLASTGPVTALFDVAFSSSLYVAESSSADTTISYR